MQAKFEILKSTVLPKSAQLPKSELFFVIQVNVKTLPAFEKDFGLVYELQKIQLTLSWYETSKEPYADPISQEMVDPVIIDGKAFETDETKAMAVGSLLAGIVVVAASPHYPVRLTEALPNLRSAVPPAAKSIWRSPCVCASCRGPWR